MATKLEDFIATVGDLPSIPSLASTVMRLVEVPDTSTTDLREVINQDPAVAARILKVANSALYGFSRSIETLNHAITLLGFRTVRNLVMAASLRETFKHFGRNEQLIWEHSSVAGAVAMRLAKLPGIDHDQEEAFTAGLLHDLGKIAFINSTHEAYQRVTERVYETHVSFAESERDEYGFDHAELGACVAEKWNLPKQLENAIRHHHDPAALEKLDESDRRLTALTTLTTACCTKLGVGRREPVAEIDLTALPSWKALELADDDADTVLLAAEEQVRQASGMIVSS